MATVSITGEVSLLWQDLDRYQGDVLLMSLDTDEPLQPNTFEIAGPLAERLKDGVLAEGMRVRVECRSETVEVVNVENGETTDEERPVVVDIILARALRAVIRHGLYSDAACPAGGVGRSQAVRQRVLVPRSGVRILPPQPGPHPATRTS